MGVKNKFCSACARTKDGDKPKNHTCFKNWKTSDGSSGMEASIIVEGFKERNKYMEFDNTNLLLMGMVMFISAF